MGLCVNEPTGRHIRVLFLALAAILLFCCSTAVARSDSRQTITSAKALKSMARVYMAASKYDTARNYAETAVQAAQRDCESDTLTSACMIDLAWVDLQLGSYTSAWNVGSQALELQKKAYGNEHIYVAYTLRILSSICREKGDYRQARATLDEAIAVMKTNAAGTNELAPFLVDLADTMTAQGKYDEAEKTYLTARDDVMASFGPSHLYTATVMTRIAALYVRQQRFDEAQQLLDTAYPILKEVFGEDNYALVDTWMTTAAILEHKGELLKAENMMKRALSRVESQYNNSHPQAARILSSLAELYLDNGNYAEATAICPMAIEKLQASLGSRHDATAMALNDLARLYVWQGRTAEASSLCSSAVTTLSQLFEPDHPDMAKVRHTLSTLLVAKAPGNISNLN